jgi:hypothetical protein
MFAAIPPLLLMWTCPGYAHICIGGSPISRRVKSARRIPRGMSPRLRALIPRCSHRVCIVGSHRLAAPLRTSHPSGSRYRASHARRRRSSARTPGRVLPAPENPQFLAVSISRDPLSGRTSPWLRSKRSRPYWLAARAQRCCCKQEGTTMVRNQVPGCTNPFTTLPSPFPST